MYSYTYDEETGGILLNTSPTNFSKEPRPVYASELDILGFDKYWNYEKQDDVPYMWAESVNIGIGENLSRDSKVEIFMKPQKL